MVGWVDMNEANREKKIDNAMKTAETAYRIYRGMKNPMTEPHWDNLTREQQGLLEWVVRWVQLQDRKE